MKFTRYIWGIKDPQTPFEKALFIWDTRIGSLMTRAKNWRMFAFFSFLIIIFQAVIIGKLAGTPQIIPYIVETAETGRVINYGKIKQYENYEIDEKVLRYHIINFIKNIKELDNNAIVTKRKWLSAYQYVTSKGSKVLTRYYREWKPLEKCEKYRSEIYIKSYLDRSSKAKEIEINEKIFDLKGEVKALKKYKIVLTVKMIKENEAKEENPLGIYIDTLIIGEEK